jgi:crotonobetainyl-CoA:carnitine CoA-transferase CaiB-like acyl-CoA transferase
VKPLAGIRVLELARILAGPWCGQLLADLGAEVIKVEGPDGDDTRRWGPPFIDHAGERAAAYYHACNRGKASVTADFGTAGGQALVRDLAAGADILIENFKLGGLAKFGLDHPALAEMNPGLIYCSITGFGQTGPYAARSGYDFIVQGMAGLMSVTGEAQGQPQKVGVAVTDVMTGVYAAVGCLAALRRRDQTGKGGLVDMALLDVAVAMMANQAMNQLASHRPPHRMGNAHPNIVPYQVFDCADGHLIIAVGNDGQFRKFCDLLGLPALGTHPDFATNPARLAHRDRLVALLSEVTRLRPKAALLAECETAGVPAGPINDMAEVFADPQVIARALQIDRDGVPGVRSPITLDGVGMAADGPSPALNSGSARWRDR